MNPLVRRLLEDKLVRLRAEQSGIDQRLIDAERFFTGVRDESVRNARAIIEVMDAIGEQSALAATSLPISLESQRRKRARNAKARLNE